MTIVITFVYIEKRNTYAISTNSKQATEFQINNEWNRFITNSDTFSSLQLLCNSYSNLKICELRLYNNTPKVVVVILLSILLCWCFEDNHIEFCMFVDITSVELFTSSKKTSKTKCNKVINQFTPLFTPPPAPRSFRLNEF